MILDYFANNEVSQLVLAKLKLFSPAIERNKLLLRFESN